MLISFIICTYNRDKYIYQCLSCLASNVTDTAWELIFVNNNSTDNTHAEYDRFLADFPNCRSAYYLEIQQGLSCARNRGIREAHGDWLVFLDDDAFVGKDYVSILARYIMALPDMVAFGGRIEPLFEVGEEPKWLCRWNQSWLSALDKGDTLSTFEGNDYPIGANMGFCRQVVQKCGNFDTTLGRNGKNLIGGEEKDYFNRIKLHHGTIYYLPEIVVQHCIPPSRTTLKYIACLGDGVGISERLRTRERGIYGRRLLQECLKWVATMILWAGYVCIGRVACGNSLVLFRVHVTKNLLLHWSCKE